MADKPDIAARVRVYARLMRIERPIGTFLLLWPALWALWIAAEGLPGSWILVVFVTGVFLMRSAGCVINDYADRRIDLHVERTRNRPFARGEVTSREALLLFAGLCAVAFLLVLTLNTLTILLSLAAVVLAASYPFMKRYTYLPQVHLGMAFAWSVPMAFAAQTGTVPQVAWLIYIATVLWTTAYDTMYAMVDRDDDIRIGVKSTAILFGEFDRPIIGIIQLLMFIVLLVAAAQLDLGAAFYLGLTVAAALALYQQYLIWGRQPEQCFRAFLNNNWLGAAIFCGIVIDHL